MSAVYLMPSNDDLMWSACLSDWPKREGCYLDPNLHRMGLPLLVDMPYEFDPRKGPQGGTYGVTCCDPREQPQIVCKQLQNFQFMHTDGSISGGCVIVLGSAHITATSALVLAFEKSTVYAHDCNVIADDEATVIATGRSWVMALRRSAVSLESRSKKVKLLAYHDAKVNLSLRSHAQLHNRVYARVNGETHTDIYDCVNAHAVGSAHVNIHGERTKTNLHDNSSGRISPRLVNAPEVWAWDESTIYLPGRSDGELPGRVQALSQGAKIVWGDR